LAKVFRTYLNNKKTSLKNIAKLKSKSKSGGIISYFSKFGDFFIERMNITAEYSI